MVSDLGVEADASSTLKLPLFSKPQYSNVGYYYQESPPHTSATVPFRWEEEPGKPRQCTSSISNPMDFSQDKCLELPPRLLSLDANVTKVTSPTTVLEGPYTSGKSRFQSSSFRIVRKDWLYGSFRKNCAIPEEGQFGPVVLKREVREKGLLGSFRWGRRGKRELGGDSYVFASFLEGEADGGYNEEDEKRGKVTRVRSARSFSAVSHNARTHFWATIYEGLKQVVPWRSRKLKKDGFMI